MDNIVRVYLNVNGSIEYFDTPFNSYLAYDPRYKFLGKWISDSDVWSLSGIVESINEQLLVRNYDYQLSIPENYPTDSPVFPLDKFPVDPSKQTDIKIGKVDPHGTYKLTFTCGSDSVNTGQMPLMELAQQVFDMRARYFEDNQQNVRAGIKVGSHAIPIEMGVEILNLTTDEHLWIDSRDSSTFEQAESFEFDGGSEYEANVYLHLAYPEDVAEIAVDEPVTYINGTTSFGATFESAEQSYINNSEIEITSIVGAVSSGEFTEDLTWSTDFDKNIYFLGSLNYSANPTFSLLNVSGLTGTVTIPRTLELNKMPLGRLDRGFSDDQGNRVCYFNDLLFRTTVCNFDDHTVTSNDDIMILPDLI